jgi:hypothetical protein
MTNPSSSIPPWLADAVMALVALAYEAGRHDERRAAQAPVVRGVASISPPAGTGPTGLPALLQVQELIKIIPAARTNGITVSDVPS